MSTQTKLVRDSDAGRQATLHILNSSLSIVIPIYLVLLAIYASVQTDALSAGQLSEQLNNGLPLVLAGAGGTLIILTANFDLSVAGVMSLTDVLTATHSLPGPGGAVLTFFLVVCVGAFVGALNGVLVALFRLPAIACTLATMIICSGVALLILSAPGGNVPDFIGYNLTGTIVNVPVALVIILAVLLGWAVLKRTNWGIALYAIGADKVAASLAGVNLRRVQFLAFSCAGALYGLAGMMLAAQTTNGDPNAGKSYLLTAFAAIAVGGTAFTGGRGGILGSVIGAMTLVLLQKLLFSLGVSSFYTGIAEGIVMILAVLITTAFTRLAGRIGE